MVMRKPASLMIAIGLPGPHGNEGQDEDSLNREQDGGNGDDIASEAIVNIVHNLHRGGPLAIRRVRLLARGLEDLCQAVMKKDDYALEEAAADARDALNNLIDGD